MNRFSRKLLFKNSSASYQTHIDEYFLFNLFTIKYTLTNIFCLISLIPQRKLPDLFNNVSTRTLT
jgi:hypothetical protein